jgi:hypothetical protein
VKRSLLEALAECNVERESFGVPKVFATQRSGSQKKGFYQRQNPRVAIRTVRARCRSRRYADRQQEFAVAASSFIRKVRQQGFHARARDVEIFAQFGIHELMSRIDCSFERHFCLLIGIRQ